VTVADKHYVIATQNGYIVDNVTGYPEEFATKQLAVKTMTELVRDAAERCRRSYKTCSVVGTARDGDVQIRVGGRQGYNLWDRFTISERSGSRKPRKESALVRELRAASKPVAAHATKKSPAQLDREIAASLASHAKKRAPRRGETAASPEMIALREEKARYLRALDYAGNTREQVKEYHRLIDEISAKMRTLPR
jgi:hypothetical protein